MKERNNERRRGPFLVCEFNLPQTMQVRDDSPNSQDEEAEPINHYDNDESTQELGYDSNKNLMHEISGDSINAENGSLDDNINNHAQNENEAIKIPTSPSKISVIRPSPFNDAFIRCIYSAFSLFIFSILSFALWFFNVNGSLSAGFALSAFGALVIFFGGFGSIILSILHRLKTHIPFQWFLLYICMSLYVFGGCVYFIGGCELAAAYNKSGLFSTSYAGTWFAEALFVALYAILSGMDLRMQMMDNKRIRIVVYSTLYAFVSLILFFCYAIMSDTTGGTADGLVAFGYFIALIVLSLCILVKVCLCSWKVREINAMKLDSFCAVLLLISMFFIMIGYIALAVEIGISEFSAYYIGFSFFCTLIGLQIAVDLKPDNIKKTEFENVNDESCDASK